MSKEEKIERTQMSRTLAIQHPCQQRDSRRERGRALAMIQHPCQQRAGERQKEGGAEKAMGRLSSGNSQTEKDKNLQIQKENRSEIP